jgi:hypothetical protein
MSLLTRQPQRHDDGIEALIEEARARQQRRWLIRIGLVVVVVVVLIAAAASLVTVLGGPTRLVRARSTPSVRPFVNVHAFKGAGDLAFISRNVIWTVDGHRGTLRSVPPLRGFSPASPEFSPNGKWLAYLETRGTNDSTLDNLWIARANGTDAREVATSVEELVGWDSNTEDLAYTSMRSIRYGQGNVVALPDKLALVAPSGTAREVLAFPAKGDRSTEITGANWSPEGTAIAVSTTTLGPAGGTAVRSYPVDGGAPTTWFTISNNAVLPGVCTQCGGKETIATVAGWWPGWGIGFWAFSSGMTHNLDDTPVELVTKPGATPRIIGNTLSDGTTEVFSADPQGELAIVASSGGREYGSGKTVDVCRRSSETCTPIPGASVWTGPPLPCAGVECSLVPAVGRAGSGVSIDPAWSPNGALLAYEKSPTVPNDGISNETWYDDHELYLWNSSTNTSKKIANLKGATTPVWSKDGRDVLYVASDALWLWTTDRVRPIEIARPLFAPALWNASLPPTQWSTELSYFEQVDFRDQFSWWSH